MTNEQAKNMLKAKLDCLKRETSGTDFDCNNNNCDECSLCYEQGNMGEQKEALDMAIKALEQQKPIEKFESVKDHIYKLAGDYKCWDNRLTDDEALELCHILEQQPSDDVMAIHTQGLDEGVRCAMCTNSMKSDRGCDGGCRFDEDMYKEVMNTIRNQIVPRGLPGGVARPGNCVDVTAGTI